MARRRALSESLPTALPPRRRPGPGLRAWRGLRRALRRPPLALVHHDAYNPGPTGFVDPYRGARIRAWLVEHALVGPRAVLVPERAGIADLDRVHDPEYLARLQDRGGLDRIFPGLGEGAAHAALSAQRWMVGGTLLAARTAVGAGRRGGPVVNLGGGLHHARRGKGSGFCAFHDVAIAVHALREEGFDGRVLIVDLDLHQGDGTRRIFAADETVYTFSIHAVAWDEEPAVAALDVALGAGIGDAAYHAALDAHLPRAFAEARPDLVFYVAGVDGALEDLVGNWRLSGDGIAARDRKVMERAGGLPLVWTLAGGYGPDAWRHTARSLAWIADGRDAPIPTGTEVSLARFRHIAGGLGREELSGGGEGADFGITLADVMGDLGGTRPETRLLGYYTPYGVEVAMERYGVTEAIRRQGIPRTRVEFDLANPTGHMVRVYADDGGGELLIELVTRETREIPPFRLLLVEWLMLQNPRSNADPVRPLLPGQRHPGLGCLLEVIGMLTMAAVRLQFDGVLFRPGWYHMAVLARGHMAFWEPREEARFAALRQALEGVPLPEATHAVAEGRVVDATTGEAARWTAPAMIYPLAPALAERLRGPGYDAAVEAAAAGLSYRRVGRREAAAVEAGPGDAAG